MILNLDFNPFINSKFEVDYIKVGEEIKSNFSNYTLGGSVVISNFLEAFGEPSILTGFLGGLNGEKYQHILIEKKLDNEFILIKDESKIKLNISDGKRNQISILDKEPRITRDEINRFLVLYLDLITNINIICGTSDTLPLGLDSESYFNLIEKANKMNKKFILQGNKLLIKDVLDANPYMVVINEEMLEYLTNINFKGKKEIIMGSNYILQKGVRFVVVCIENGELLLLSKNRSYRIFGDLELEENNLRKIVAGFALGINRNYNLEMTLRLAYAFNNYKVSELPEEIEIAEIKKLMKKANIESIDEYKSL